MKTKKRILKKVLIICIFIVVACLLMNKCYAFGDIVASAESWVSSPDAAPITISQAASDLSPVTNILFTIATGVLFVVGLIIGVKYMMSEPNDKAKIKEKVIWFFIAIILVYSGIAIANIVANFFADNL